MYAGYQYDKESKYYNLHARYYDPQTARFLQQDTYTGTIDDPLSLNLYAYCHNEPMMYFDPTGYDAVRIRDMATKYHFGLDWEEKSKSAILTSPTGFKFVFTTTIIDGKMYIDEDHFLYATGLKAPSSFNAVIAATRKTQAITKSSVTKNQTNDINVNKGTGKTGGARTMSEFKKLYGDLIEERAKELGVDPNVLAAVIFQESAGSGFFENGNLKIRFENHIFLSKNKAGKGKDGINYLDYFTNNSSKNHKFRLTKDGEWKILHTAKSETTGEDEYAAFNLAKSFNENAAYESISMGLGQQMGFNYEACGYVSAKEMFEDYSKDEDRQINGMINFIKNYYDKGMVEALKKKDYDTFVTKYNGSKNDKYVSNMKKYEQEYKSAK